MKTLITDILQGANKTDDHDSQQLHRAKQLGYVMETPTGFLCVTDSGLEVYYGDESEEQSHV